MLYTRFAYDRAGRTLGLAGLVLWSVSFVFEGSAKPLFIPNGLYHLEVALEEASEMLGGTCLLMAFVSYAGRRVFAPAVMPRPHWRPILAASLGTTAVAAAAIGVLTLSNPTYMLRRAGDKFVETTDFARAVAAYGKAVEIDPENRDLWKRLGKAALRARDYPVSANAFERAVGIEADDVSAQNDLGVALYYSGRYQEARVAYEKALELDPKYARAHKNLGVLFEKTGASKDAESEYRAALALDAEMADVHRYLGNLLARGGNTAAAREHWQKSLHLDPRQRSAAELWRRIAEASAPATAAG
jgi:tetratricopeptide (TPR) repeat protein